MKNVLGCFVVFFCMGIICVYLFKVSFQAFYIIALILALSCMLLINKGLSFEVTLCALIFTLGALCLKNSYTTPKTDIGRYIRYRNNGPYIIKGFINSKPVFKDAGSSFIFRVEELGLEGKRYKSCGNIRVAVKGINNFSYGEGLILFGSAYRPYRFFTGKIPLLMQVKKSSSVTRLNTNKGSLFKKSAFFLKDNAESVFLRHLSPLAASINRAMILGDKKSIPAAVYDYMVKSATVHIMVVSGFHVGVIAFISGVLLKILRIPRRIRYFGVIFFLILYCFITGASTPVMRATVMGVFLTIGCFLQRETSLKSSLSLAALFILAINPRDLFSISFQLSFASVAAIAYLYPCLKALFQVERLRIGFLKVIANSLLISFSAWLGTAGLIAYYFKIISPVAILANLFIIPLASLLIISGLSLAIASVFPPVLLGAFAGFNELIVFLLLWLGRFFSDLPFAYRYL
ncbi:MAG: ComEC/Rec2 family competence protein [Candidatus Omnitrophica bacterium]|jgi:competence protein ComEC|nr:ComEC/Rec2 family competence protein [Candidatus Omnitrophota bacterium]MDD3987371.1 ComEC/Rec2 family competence protein [Candidatus Omnitrophota bacterium]MDD5664970.1 ComEC/Rec2 family competence protein [Candidatus Omnitrophota bacterium]